MQNSKDNIIQFKKNMLFRNGNLVDLQTGIVTLVDILVENEKISSITEAGTLKNFSGDEENLYGDFVLPAFVNAFCHSDKALEAAYGLERLRVPKGNVSNLSIEKMERFLDPENFDAMIEMSAVVLCSMKNVLSGAIFVNDLSERNDMLLLDNFIQQSESQLDELCEKAKDKKLFLKVGQTLEELGTIDKQYKKPLSQVLEDFGLLDNAPLIVGGNCLEKDELQLLRNYDCRFVLCPYEDAKFGRRPTNLNALRSMDFHVGLGSGYAFEIDFFAYMRQLILTMRGMFEDENILSEQEALQIAVGQKLNMFLGENRTKASGEIKEGEFANFIVVKHTETMYDDIFKSLVWEKSKHDVVMTVNYGKIMQKNGHFLAGMEDDFNLIKKTIKMFTRRKNNDN